MARTDDPRPRRWSELTNVTRKELSESWESPHHGYHRNAVLHDPVRQRILDAAAVMPPGAVVGGWAAAYLHGATHLDGRDEPVLLLLPADRVVKRPGIQISRVALDPVDVTTKQGISCSTGTRAGFDLLRLAPDLTEAVTAGDCVVRTGLTTQAGLLSYAAEHPRRRGLRQLRAALPLVNPAAASPPESRLRMLCGQRAGLPGLLVNVPLYGATGDFLGIPDLLEPVTGLVIEYDGGTAPRPRSAHGGQPPGGELRRCRAGRRTRHLARPQGRGGHLEPDRRYVSSQAEPPPSRRWLDRRVAAEAGGLSRPERAGLEQVGRAA